MPLIDDALAIAELKTIAPTYPLPRIELIKGRGTRVWDAAGREYLDFASGIAVNAFGHAPLGLARAVARQMRDLVHVSNLYANAPARTLARRLTALTGYDRAFFCNSGTEGVEAALKFARAHARARGREGRAIVAFRGGFHGRTALALSATFTPGYREPFEPLVPGVRFADYNDAASLDAVLDEQVCAVIVEPVQGEGGAVPATRDFLHAVRARADALGALLVFDEVQSGMGRCGHLLAAEAYGVRADLTVLSKALGGGLPLAAVLMTEAVAGSLAPGMHGCTFGGGPVAATAGLWTLDRVSRPGFLARVRRRGRELGAALDALAARHASLASARGLGLLRAVELAPDAPYTPAELVARARGRGLLAVRGGERAVRLLPPLTVSAAEIEEAVARFEGAVSALETPHTPEGPK
jgi:predicted acetylornithine/succinylornithine family transaminase